MPVCDGENCGVPVAWHINRRRLRLAGRDVLFDSDDIRYALNSVITPLDDHLRMPPIGHLEPVFRNYCMACWHARNPVGHGHFAVDDPTFATNGKPDIGRILSHVMRSLMHQWSYQGSGLTSVNGTLAVDWDQLVSDFLAFKTFQLYYRAAPAIEHYVTPNASYANAIERAAAVVQALPPATWRDWMACGNVCAALPPELRDFIHIQNQPHMRLPEPLMRFEVARKAKAMLFQALVFWFFQGPTRIAPGIDSHCRDFLSPQGIDQLIPASFVFKSFPAKRETAIPIGLSGAAA